MHGARSSTSKHPPVSCPALLLLQLMHVHAADCTPSQPADWPIPCSVRLTVRSRCPGPTVSCGSALGVQKQRHASPGENEREEWGPFRVFIVY